jgi:hypothetical protein
MGQVLRHQVGMEPALILLDRMAKTKAAMAAAAELVVGGIVEAMADQLDQATQAANLG